LRYYLHNIYYFAKEECTINFDTEERGQSNRLFIFLALALVGLTCLGLLGLGAALFLRQNNQAQQEAAAVTIEAPPPTPLPTDTPLPPPPTDTPTPLPTPTGTLVVSNIEGQPAAEEDQTFTIEDFLPQPTEPPLPEDATPTSTLVVQSGVPASETATPAAGGDELAEVSPPVEMPPGGGVLPAERHNAVLWAGIALLLTLVVGVAVRLKSSA